ncbi:MAG: hypothetical protein SFY80_16000 [Verrucomicrobiota bacterium]|nr:hypothetical protein [Verrucomicrobiota bacterium]
MRPNTEDFIYDDDGNMLQDGLFYYDYDAENRLAVTHFFPIVFLLKLVS